MSKEDNKEEAPEQEQSIWRSLEELFCIFWSLFC